MIVCKIMAIVGTCALPSQMGFGVAVLPITPWIPTAGTAAVSLVVSYSVPQCSGLPGACNPCQCRRGRDTQIRVKVLALEVIFNYENGERGFISIFVTTTPSSLLFLVLLKGLSR